MYVRPLTPSTTKILCENKNDTVRTVFGQEVLAEKRYPCGSMSLSLLEMPPSTVGLAGVNLPFPPLPNARRVIH